MYLAFALVVALTSLTAIDAFGATRTWTGGGGDANWSTAANWDTGAPVSGDTLVFPAVANQTNNNNNDIASLSTPSVTIAASGYVLAGNAINLAGVSTNQLIASYPSGLSTVSLDVIGATQSGAANRITVANASAELLISGVVSGGLSTSQSWIFVGPGTLRLANTNTMRTLTTTSPGGLIRIQHEGALGTGSLSFRDGTVRIEVSTTYDGLVSPPRGLPGTTGGLEIASGTTTLTGNLFVSALNQNPAIGVFSGATLNIPASPPPPATPVPDSSLRTPLTLNIDGTATIGRRLVRFDDITPGRLIKNGTGVLTLSGSNTYGTTELNAGTLLVNGSQPLVPVALKGGALGGSGAVGAITATGGAISRFLSPGILSSGSVTLGAGSSTRVGIGGITAGTQYDQLNVTGAISVAGTLTVQILGGFEPPAGSSFVIVNNDGTDPVTGTFAGLPEGALIVTGNRGFTISYAGGDGNDIVLNALAIVLAPPTLPDGMAGAAYSQTLTATGGIGPPFTFAVSSGPLPPDLTLASATGVLSGTPTSPGTFAFSVSATDSASIAGSHAYSIVVLPPLPAIVIAPATLPDARVGTAYSQTVTATGGAGPPFTFTVSAGSLPAGLTLASATGVLSGTPTADGTFAFTVSASDAASMNGSKAYSLIVRPQPTVEPIVLAPATLPPGTPGTAYSQTLTATGGAGPPFTFTVSAGSLPTGLTLDSATGVLSGTPASVGTFAFTISATDSAGVSGSQAYSLVVTVVTSNVAIPTLSSLALLVLVLALASAMLWQLRRRSA